MALRRAISLGMDVETEIRRVRRGQAIVAQSLVLPNTTSGFTLDRKCSSGLNAIALAARAIRCDEVDVAVAGGEFDQCRDVVGIDASTGQPVRDVLAGKIRKV